jgi:hypothetical protein
MNDDFSNMPKRITGLTAFPGSSAILLGLNQHDLCKTNSRPFELGVGQSAHIKEDGGTVLEPNKFSMTFQFDYPQQGIISTFMLEAMPQLIYSYAEYCAEEAVRHACFNGKPSEIAITEGMITSIQEARKSVGPPNVLATRRNFHPHFKNRLNTYSDLCRYLDSTNVDVSQVTHAVAIRGNLEQLSDNPEDRMVAPLTRLDESCGWGIAVFEPENCTMICYYQTMRDTLAMLKSIEEELITPYTQDPDSTLANKNNKYHFSGANFLQLTERTLSTGPFPSAN